MLINHFLCVVLLCSALRLCWSNYFLCCHPLSSPSPRSCKINCWETWGSSCCKMFVPQTSSLIIFATGFVLIDAPKTSIATKKSLLIYCHPLVSSSIPCLALSSFWIIDQQSCKFCDSRTVLKSSNIVHPVCYCVLSCPFCKGFVPQVSSLFYIEISLKTMLYCLHYYGIR